MNTEIKAIAKHSKLGQSLPISARFLRVPGERKVKLAFPFAPQYAASGPSALIDMLEGGNDYRTGEWQGFEGVDVDAVVDMRKLPKSETVPAKAVEASKEPPPLVWPEVIDMENVNASVTLADGKVVTIRGLTLRIANCSTCSPQSGSSP